MEVILRQDVEKLGKAGALIKVKDGFAHNFLIPNKLAMPATPANLKILQQDQQRQQAQSEKIKKECEQLKERLEKASLTIPALVQNQEKLYGSISGQEIAAALKEEGIEIDKSVFIMDEPIKSLGIYEISVKLHPEVIAKVKVWIVKK
jgi:large subunit ribosomal protein L9